MVYIPAALAAFPLSGCVEVIGGNSSCELLSSSVDDIIWAQTACAKQLGLLWTRTLCFQCMLLLLTSPIEHELQENGLHVGSNKVSRLIQWFDFQIWQSMTHVESQKNHISFVSKMFSPAQKNLSEEDSSGSDTGSGVEPETDRFGFILTSRSTAGWEVSYLLMSFVLLMSLVLLHCFTVIQK